MEAILPIWIRGFWLWLDVGVECIILGALMPFVLEIKG